MKVIKFLLLFALSGYATLVCILYVMQRNMLYPGSVNARTQHEATAPWGEWVDIATPDGERLAALYQPAAEGRPTVLFFHGNGDNIIYYDFLANAFRADGVGLLAVSFRGFPGSTGAPSEAGLLTDGLAAWDWLAAKTSQPVFVLGRSLGTGVAVNTAGQRPAAGLALVSAYDSIGKVASNRFPFIPVKWLIKDSFNSDERIGSVSCPKLFIHGDLDRLIPLTSGQRLFARAPEPKFFVIEQGFEHNDIWTPSSVQKIRYFITMTAGSAE